MQFPSTKSAKVEFLRGHAKFRPSSLGLLANKRSQDNDGDESDCSGSQHESIPIKQLFGMNEHGRCDEFESFYGPAFSPPTNEDLKAHAKQVYAQTHEATKRGAQLNQDWLGKCVLENLEQWAKTKGIYEFISRDDIFVPSIGDFDINDFRERARNESHRLIFLESKESEATGHNYESLLMTQIASLKKAAAPLSDRITKLEMKISEVEYEMAEGKIADGSIEMKEVTILLEGYQTDLEKLEQLSLERNQQILQLTRDLMKCRDDKAAWKSEVLKAREVADALGCKHHADNVEALRRLNVLLQAFMELVRLHIASPHTKFLEKVLSGEQIVQGDSQNVMRDGAPRAVIILLERSFRGAAQEAVLDCFMRMCDYSQEKTPSKRFHEVHSLMSSEGRNLKSMGIETLSIDHLVGLWSLLKMSPAERVNWDKRNREQQDQRREQQLLYGLSPAEFEEQFPEVSISEKLQIYANSDQKDHQLSEHLRVKDKNILVGTESSDKTTKTAQLRLQDQNRQVMVVGSVIQKVLDFAKSNQASQKLQGTWCYKFMSSKGCHDSSCDRTHIAELAGVDLCIPWCTKGTCVSGDKCQKSDWHRNDLKCILTKARGPHEHRPKADKVVQSVNQSTESHSSATKVRFAAEIQPKSQSSDSAGSRVALVMLSANTVHDDSTSTTITQQDCTNTNNTIQQSCNMSEATHEKFKLACRVRTGAARFRRRLLCQRFVRKSSHSNLFRFGQHKGLRYRSAFKGRGRGHFKSNTPGARYRRKQNFKLRQNLQRGLLTYELTARSFWADNSSTLLQHLRQERSGRLQYDKVLQELLYATRCTRLPVQSRIRHIQNIRRSKSSFYVDISSFYQTLPSVSLKRSVKTLKTMCSLARVSPDLSFSLPICVFPVLGSSLLDDSEELHSVSAISKSSIAKEDVSIMWDAGSCYHILQHKSHILQPTPYHQTVVGLAGKRQITHRGHARPEYGLTHPEAVFIANSGGLPNIMSVSQENKVDSAGMQGGTLYLSNIAYKFRVSPVIEELIVQLLTCAAETDVLTGTAHMEHGVYVQQISGTDPQREEYKNVSAAVRSLFNRVPLSSNLEAVGMLAAAGYPQTTLLAFASGLVKGWPPELQKPDIDLFFDSFGKDNPALRAHISRCPCHQVLEYEKNVPTKVGEFLQIDAITPSMAYVPGSKAAEDKPATRGKYEPSAQGYTSYVRAIDPLTGVAVGRGRMTKEDPHQFVAEFTKLWLGKWGNQLSVLFTDDEFITQESVKLFSDLVPNGRIRQPPPAEHNRGLQCIEGSHRSIQDRAQASMNRGLKLVASGLITDRQHRSLWYEAFQLAEFIDLGAPAWHDSTKTKYELFYNREYNFSAYVVLPFLTPMVCRRINAGRDGRGDTVYYLRPSETAIGSLRAFDPTTGRIRILYSFIPRDNMFYDEEWDYVDIAGRVYKDFSSSELEDLLNHSSPTLDTNLGTRIVDSIDPPDDFHTESLSSNQGEDMLTTVDEEDIQYDSNEASITEEDQSNIEQTGDMNNNGLVNEGSPIHPKSNDKSGEITTTNQVSRRSKRVKHTGEGVQPYFTRSGRSKKVPSKYDPTAMLAWRILVVTERPPKPTVTGNKRQRREDIRWKESDKREVDKLISAGVMVKLPRDEYGRYILPDNCIKMRLIDLHEYKWKPDPVTGEECWLECTRIVCDGSCDTREGELTYAECPDRTILHVMTSRDSVERAWVYQADIERAYLQATSIDRNLVVITSTIPAFGEALMMLDKGLYGAKKAALGFQLWTEDKLLKMQYTKMNIAKSIYVKRVQDAIIRIYRHSDDFRISCTHLEILQAEMTALALEFNFGAKGFTLLTRFLGCEYERIDLHGNPCLNGQITLVRCTEKIDSMAKEYSDLRDMFKISNTHQFTQLPTDPLRGDDKLDEDMKQLLTVQLIKRYMSIVGSIGYVACSVRMAIRFSHFVLARRLQNPRVWDLYMSVWVLEYLVATRDMPLVLGGESCSLRVRCDASLGSLPDRRSVGAHVLTTSMRSGACYVMCSVIKSVVVSIFEAELNAYVDGLDTILYVMHACDEMLYVRESDSHALTDSQSTLDWIESGASSRRSRHVELRLQKARQIIMEGEVTAGHVESKDNISDLFTKYLDIKQSQYLTFTTMGHDLVVHLDVAGVIVKF